MNNFSLEYLLKDLKRLDTDELFEKTKQLYYENEKQASLILNLEAEIITLKAKVQKQKLKQSKIINYNTYKPIGQWQKK